MSRPPVRVLVVDDERPARARLLALLARQPGVQVTADCAGGAAALAAIADAARAGAPVDVVFLDVQMPEMDGFAMLESLSAMPLAPTPVVVFATAYDEYALRAFDAHAVDYLLKPYSDERFEVALTRAVRLARSGSSEALVAKLRALLDGLAAPAADAADAADAAEPRAGYLDRLALKERGRVRLVDVGEIRWIAADGVYVTIHTARARYLHREVLGHLEARLDPRRFVRIHRSHIVNFDAVHELVQDEHGEYAVRLADAPLLKVSRTYRPRLEERLRQRL